MRHDKLSRPEDLITLGVIFWAPHKGSSWLMKRTNPRFSHCAFLIKVGEAELVLDMPKNGQLQVYLLHEYMALYQAKYPGRPHETFTWRVPTGFLERVKQDWHEELKALKGRKYEMVRSVLYYALPRRAYRWLYDGPPLNCLTLPHGAVRWFLLARTTTSMIGYTQPRTVDELHDTLWRALNAFPGRLPRS